MRHSTLKINVLSLIAMLIVLCGAAAVHAATISGTITNSTSKSGRVYIGLRDSGGNRNIGVSTTIAASPGTATYTITGVPEDQSYTLEAYLDTADCGMQHANDPQGSLAGQTYTGTNTDKNITLVQPPLVSFNDADPSGDQFTGMIIPSTDGTAAFIEIGEVPYASVNGVMLPIPEKIKITCSGAGAVATPFYMPVNDNRAAFYSGLSAIGSLMECTAVPVVGGVEDTENQIIFSQVIGPWNPAATDNGNPLFGRPAGASVTLNYTISGLTPGASTPLYIGIEDTETSFPIIKAVPTPTASGTVTVTNVPAGTYRVYGILDANNDHLMNAGDLMPMEHQIPRVVVDNLQTSYHAGTVTLDATKKVDARVEVSHQYSFGSLTDPVYEWYNVQFRFDNRYCQVAHVSLNNNSPLPVQPISYPPITLIPGNWGSVDYWNNGSGTRPSDDSNAPDIYLATITYTNSAVCPTDSNVPLQIVAIADSPPRPVFPWGPVNFSGTQQACWQTPSPFPWYYWEYSGDGDSMSDGAAPSTLVTGLNGVQATWWNGEMGWSAWSLDQDDLFGNRAQITVPYTVMGSGPVITGLSTSSGPAGTPVTITGDGFLDPIVVTFNGKLADVVSSSATSISTTVPEGAGVGPVTVTAGGTLGVGTTTASVDSFTPTISWGATYSNPAASSYMRVSKPGQTCNTTTTTGCVSGATAHILGTTLSDTTDANGTYTIQGVPAGVPLEIMVTHADYRDSYSALSSGNSDVNVGAFGMIDDAMLTSWNTAAPGSMTNVINDTKGLIRSSVRRNYDQSIAGAVVRAYSWRNSGAEYTVVYGDSPGTGNTQPPNPALTQTGNSGRFYVLDVDDGDFVTVVAEKDGYVFRDRVFHVRAGAISQSGSNYGDVAPTVTLSTPGQTGPNYTDPLTVQLTTSVPSTIYYTTNGADPRLFGTECSSTPTADPCSFVLPAGDYTVRYAAKLGAPVNAFGVDYSQTLNVINDTTPPTVLATPPGYTISVPTTFKSAVFPLNVPFTASEPSTIYYTTNGADPTTSPQGTLSVSSNWGTSEGIQISAGQTLKFYAKDASNNNSEVQQITYSTTSAASFQGTVYDSAFAAISGATVSMMGNPSISSSSGPDGSFTLDNLPQAQSLTLKVENTPLGKQDTYSHIMTINSPTLTGRSFQLFTLAEMQGWGHEAGTGVIHGTVQQGSAGGGEPIGGAHVSVTGSTGSYTVLYDDGTGMTPGNGTSTSANGVFYIVGVIPGDILTITASRTGFTFLTRYFQGHADAVSYGTIIGTVDPPPSISGITYYGYNGTAHYALSTVGYDISATDNGPISYLVTMDDSTPSLSNPNWSGASYWEETGRSAGTYTRYAWVKDATGSIVGPTMISFTVDFTSPTTTATPSSTPASGYYVPGTTVNVSLTPSEAGVTYYTTNGSDPTTGSSVYGGAIPVTLTTVLKFFSVDLAGNTESSVSSATLSFGRVKVSGTVSAYNALTAAIGGIDATDRIITAKADIFAENVVVNKPSLAMKLSGGYDATLAGTPGGTTVIDGSLKIRAGALRVQKLAIR